MSETPRNPSPGGTPDDDSNEGGRRQARPGENQEGDRSGERGSGTKPDRSGQNRPMQQD